MKKLTKFFLFPMVLMFFFTYGRAQTTDFSAPAIINGLYNQVGLIHNDQLDKMYSQLVRISGSITEQIPLQTINQNVFAELQNDLTITNVKLTQFYVGDLFINVPEYTTLSLKECIAKATGFSISGKLNDAFTKLEELFWSDDIEKHYNSIDDLVQNMIPTLSDPTDKAIFASTASVAKNSLMYWNENSIKWDELRKLLGQQIGDPKQNVAFVLPTGYNKNYTSLEAESNNYNYYPLSFENYYFNLIQHSQAMNVGKDVAYADIAGAAVGAVHGAYIGLTGGTIAIPGLGTAVGGACGVLVGTIGGAIGSSVVAAVHSFIKWLINW